MKETLASYEEALKFVGDVLESTTKVVNESKTFSPFAIIFATQNNKTQIGYKEPKAFPISIEIIRESLPEQDFEDALLSVGDALILLEAFVEESAYASKAIGLVYITQYSNESLWAVFRHQKGSAKAWAAKILWNEDVVSGVDPFVPVDDYKESNNLLPAWN